MSCSTELPLIISADLELPNAIPKFIRLKNLPISPKYRAKMETSQFDESANKLSDLEFPVLTTPPISPAKPNISPRNTTQYKNSVVKLPRNK